MKVDTSQFEASHGRKPRGEGCWHFEITFTDGNGRYATETRQAWGTMAKARSQAWRELKSECGAAKQAIEIIVLP